MADVMLGLLRGRWLAPEPNDLALSILKRQQYRDIVGRGLPALPDGRPICPVASKSGELGGVHHDVAIVWTPTPLVVTVLSDGGLDPREHPDNREVVLLSRLTRALIEVLGDILPRVRGLG